MVTALILDCDGVLADTERYGHLPAFNATFEEYGLPVRWSEREYADKLRIGGGKERMASLFGDPHLVELADLPRDEVARRELLAQWHRTKTRRFKELVAAGQVPPRPGVARLVESALDAGWSVAVASTSAEPSVRAVLTRAVGEELAERVPVFAGDVVTAKKPDPAIYQLTLRELRLDPADTVVIEDSRNGLMAAVAAGLSCVITVNDYTRDERFDEAALVVSDLGEPESPPLAVLSDPRGVHPRHHITLTDLQACLGSAARERQTDDVRAEEVPS